MNLPQKRICVFCGSTMGSKPAYEEAAAVLGALIVASGFGMVYGGGASGLMGIVAKSALQKNGHVVGVIPSALVTVENALYDVSEYHEVSNFHERKMLMSKLSDAFIALPGGPGTLEELIEQITWAELGYHNKPIFIVNTDGYWNLLIKLLEYQVKETAISQNSEVKYFIVDKPEQAIEQILKMK